MREILLIGESITNGQPPPNHEVPRPWSKQLEEHVGPRWRVRNEAVAGSSAGDWDPNSPYSTRPEMFKPIPTPVNAGTHRLERVTGRPRIAVVALGGADAIGFATPHVHRPPGWIGEPATLAEYAAHMKGIVDYLRRRRIRVVVQSPVAPDITTSHRHNYYRQWGAWAQEHYKMRWVSWAAPILTPDDYWRRDVHPLQSGHDKIAESVIAAIGRFL